MALFRYKAVADGDKVIEGVLEAPDRRTVFVRLEEQRQLPIRVISTERGTLLGHELRFPWKKKRINQKDLLVFTRELSTLVEAGLTLDRSLSILGDLSESTYLREIVRELLKELKSGKSLSEGLSMYPAVFPKLYVNMIKAGEIGGLLDQILVRMTEYLEDVEEFRDNLISSLIYPAILAFVATLSIVTMVIFVIPKFSAIFGNAGIPVPLPMKILLAFSAILTGYWWLLILLIGGGCSWFASRLRVEEVRLKYDRWLLRLPILGSVLQKIEVSRFSRTMGTLLRSSVPLIQSINIVREIVGNRVVVSAMKSIKSGVKKGEGLASPIRESGIFPPFALHLLEVGEETGNLDGMLIQIADIYDRELKVTLKRLIALFEPIIILIMGVIIGLMVIAMLHSILSINDVPL